MSDLILDPAKTYAELAPYTNLVARVFAGYTIPSWAMTSARRIIEIPSGVTVEVGYRYHNGTFGPVPPPPTPDERATLEVDSPFYRLLFDVNYDQETRLRVIEGKPAITRLQYRNALITRWKELNS